MTVDLTQLGNRTADAPVTRPRRNRVVWLTRFLLPAVLIVGFAGAVLWSFREALLPAREVTVVPVIASRAEVEQADAPLFSSAGWVEARPTPVLVSSLEEGVVEELLVIEGQELKPGQVVAKLIDADAKLYLRDAEAQLASRRAELASARAALAAAETRLKEPLQLETSLAEAEAMLARVENEIARLPSRIQAVRARADLAAKEVASRRQSADAVSGLALARSESEQATAQSEIAELESQRTALVREKEAQARRVTALRRQLELKVEEKRQHQESVAAVDLAEARLAQANVTLDTAKLRLSRTVIQAPTEGKVLALVARPGTKVMGLTPATMPDAATVITMYDPGMLQVRADVRLEEVPRVFTGQKVRIETPAVKGLMTGSVITATSLTDIQKNTLQVKVSVDDPPAVLKPDMLVTVTFLAPPGNADSSGKEQTMQLAIPPDLIHEDGDTAFVWVADRRRGVAQRREIALGSPLGDGLREVKSGLAIGDRLIAGEAEGLRDGDRIRIVREKPSDEATQNTPKDHSRMKMKRL